MQNVVFGVLLIFSSMLHGMERDVSRAQAFVAGKRISEWDEKTQEGKKHKLAPVAQSVKFADLPEDIHLLSTCLSGRKGD